MREWRPIPLFEGLYEASDDGFVRSLDRKVTGVWGRSKLPQARTHKGLVLSAYENKERGGYRYVNLRKDGRQHLRRVARLVAAAFLGPCPSGMVVCHNNGIANDDNIKNLRYDTPKANSYDQWNHGTKLYGDKSPCTKISDADVLIIRSSKEPQKVLAKRYGVHPNHITNIRCGLRRKTK